MAVSSFVPRQIPALFRRDYPLFVRFIQTYYEYLQQSQYPVDILQRIDGLRDVFLNPDNLDRMALELFHGLPGKTVADKTQLLIRSQEFFRSKGTEESLKFIFRVLFGTDVQVSYPGDDLLIPSWGNWKTGEYLEVSGIVPLDASLVTQEGSPPVSATIIDVVYKTDVEAVTFDITGIPTNITVLEDESIFLTSEDESVNARFEIQLGSQLNPATHQGVTLDYRLYDAEIVLVEEYVVGTGYQDVVMELDGSVPITVTVDGYRITFLGKALRIDSLRSESVDFTKLEIDNPTGEFSGVDVIVSGSAYVMKTVVGNVSEYIDTKHHISGDAKIFDGFFRSPYSYLIEGASRTSVDDVGGTIRRIVHPEGLVGMYRFEDNYAVLYEVPLAYPTDRSLAYQVCTFDRETGMNQIFVGFQTTANELVSISLIQRDVSWNVLQTTIVTAGDTIVDVNPDTDNIIVRVNVTERVDSGGSGTYYLLEDYDIIETENDGGLMLENVTTSNALRFSYLKICDQRYLETLDADYHRVIS